MDLTQQDITQAIKELLEHPKIERPEGALRTLEISKELGLSEKRIRRILNDMKENDLIEVCQIRITTLANQNTIVPGYRLKRND